MKEIISFIHSKPDSGISKLSANQMVAFDGKECKKFILVLKGKIKVYKVSREGKSITLYHILENEACILTTSAIFNQSPFPAMAETVTDCEVIHFPANMLRTYFNESEEFRKFVFALLLDKMASLVFMVDSLAFSKFEDRLYAWLKQNNVNKVVKITHSEIANQLASSREVVSRSLKTLEKKKLISLGRGNIFVL